MNKRSLSFVLLLFIILNINTAFAAPPQGGYAPGATLNPDCAPSTNNCFVALLQSPILMTDKGVLYAPGLSLIDNPLPILPSLPSCTIVSFEEVIGQQELWEEIFTPDLLEILLAFISNPSDPNNFLLIESYFDLEPGDINNGGYQSYLSGLFFAELQSQLNSNNADCQDEYDVYQEASDDYYDQLENGPSGYFNIFLGYQSGETGEDVSANSSIALGNYTSSGGYSNSIALGTGAVNTSTNQLYLSDSIQYLSLRGINYELPSSGGNPNTVLMNDGGGGLSWVSSVIIEDDNIYTPSIGSRKGNSGNIILGKDAGRAAGEGVSNSIFIGNESGQYMDEVIDSIFIGRRAGDNANNMTQSVFIGPVSGSGTNGDYSVFVGYSAGSGATESEKSVFLGYNAGQSADNARNSIFIGYGAGSNDNVNNTLSLSNSSILIGNETSTGGYSNSIALGASAQNTSSNQLMIGSSSVANSAINSTIIRGSSGTSCTITTGTGMSCSSDERLKEGILDLGENTLDKLLNVRAVTYKWKDREDSPEQIGFLAQDIEQQFPELVLTDHSDGYKSVYYSQMTPVLTKAIQQLYEKFMNIFSFFDADRIRANKIEVKELCVGATCITETQLIEFLELRNQNNQGNIDFENIEDNTDENTSNEDASETPEVSNEELDEQSNNDDDLPPEEITLEQEEEIIAEVPTTETTPAVSE